MQKILQDGAGSFFSLCSQVCFSTLDNSIKISQVSDLAEKNVWKLGYLFYYYYSTCEGFLSEGKRFNQDSYL